ncbi:MAG: ribosome maturation factor RimP [Solirubrobacteraceae bacterium]|nr:ribosome maturation factor RimP [Solirubrobacteraceae bacterium]
MFRAAGESPLFLWLEPPQMPTMTVQEEIETILASAQPDVEVLRVDPIGKDTLRIYIDTPAGVTLDVCTQVTHALAPVRERFAVEVSSPGIKRPLTRPAHFERFVGRTAKLTLRAPKSDRITWRGEIVASDDAAVTLGTDQGLLVIEHAEIKQANLTGDDF